ncbi:MAG: hypothetical protein WAP08_09670 [Smithellaceae bacterium]|jgi:hypothetical protein
MYKLPETLMPGASSEGENTMLEVTDKASEVIKDFLKDKGADAAIRITMSFG